MHLTAVESDCILTQQKSALRRTKQVASPLQTLYSIFNVRRGPYDDLHDPGEQHQDQNDAGEQPTLPGLLQQHVRAPIETRRLENKVKASTALAQEVAKGKREDKSTRLTIVLKQNHQHYNVPNQHKDGKKKGEDLLVEEALARDHGMKEKRDADAHALAQVSKRLRTPRTHLHDAHGIQRWGR